MPLYRSKCDTTKKICISEKGGSLHTEGSISVLQRKVTWRVDDEEKIKKIFHSKSSHTLSYMFKMAHQEGKQPLKWLVKKVNNHNELEILFGKPPKKVDYASVSIKI